MVQQGDPQRDSRLLAHPALDGPRTVQTLRSLLAVVFNSPPGMWQQLIHPSNKQFSSSRGTPHFSFPGDRPLCSSHPTNDPAWYNRVILRETAAYWLIPRLMALEPFRP